MSEFGWWLKALLPHWWALMSCAVFTLIGVLVLGFNKSSKWALYATFGAAVAMLFLASFLAWRDQYRATVGARKELEEANAKHKKEIEELTLPIIRGSFNEPMMAPAGTNNSDTLLVVGLTIANYGAPTALRFGIKIVLADGTQANVASVIPPFGPINLETVDKRSFQLSGDHYLPRKVGETPILHNGSVSGYLLYKIEGISEEKLRNQKFDIFVVCFDVYERPFTLQGLYTPNSGGGHKMIGLSSVQEPPGIPKP